MQSVDARGCAIRCGYPRSDLKCICKKALQALPPYDMDDAEIDRLYEEFGLSLRTRAEAEISALRVQQSAALKSDRSKPRDLFRALVTHAPALLAYAGVLAYVVGRVYLQAYNRVLLPDVRFEYGYFSTIASLVNFFPLSLFAAMWLVPPIAAVVNTPAREQELVVRHVRASERADHYIGLAAYLVWVQVKSTFYKHGMLKRLVGIHAFLRLAFRVSGAFGAVRRGVRRNVIKEIGVMRYLPIAAVHSRRSGTLLLTAGIAWLIMFALLIFDYLSRGWNSDVRVLVAMYGAALIVVLAFIPVRTAVLCFRQRVHTVAAVVMVTSVIASLLLAVVMTGQSEARDDLASAPVAAVGLTNGTVRQGHLVTSPSSTSVFLLVGARQLQFAATEVVWVQTDRAGRHSGRLGAALDSWSRRWRD